MDYEKWKAEYDAEKTQECPCCNAENLEHDCRECRSSITKDDCWKNDGYCDKCFKFINSEIPEIEKEKERLGIKCICVDKHCTKCLRGHCKDENCITHAKELKKLR